MNFKVGDKFICNCGTSGCSSKKIRTVDNITEDGTIISIGGQFDLHDQKLLVKEEIYNSPLFKIMGEEK